MKARLISRIMLIAFVLSLLVACSEGGNSILNEKTRAHDYLSTVDKVYQNIFAAVEGGEYAKAEKIIQEKIIGNITTEEESQIIMQSYVEALLTDYNEGTITNEDVDLIVSSFEQTSFSDYSSFWYLTEEYYTLKMSKEAYQSGQDSYMREDWEDAITQLSSVSENDMNYIDALSTLADIAEHAYNGSESNLRTAGVAALKCIRLLSNFGFFHTSTDVDSAFEDAINSLDAPAGSREIRDRIAPIAFQIANSLDANGYSMFAMHLYSLLRSEISEAGDEFVRLGRQLYFECSVGSELYSLDENGVINCESDIGFMVDHKDVNAVQMVASERYNAYSNNSPSFYAYLRPDGTVHLVTTEEEANMDEYVDFRNEVNNLVGVVKLFAPSSHIYNKPYLIALTDQGSISICGTPDSDCFELLDEDLIDFYGDTSARSPLFGDATVDGRYIVLTLDGDTHVTSSVDNPGQYLQNEVKSIDGFGVFLKDSGDIYITNTRTTVSGTFRSVAGGCAVSEDGRLSDLLGQDLNSDVFSYMYSRLVHVSHLIGYTVDGERIVIK